MLLASFATIRTMRMPRKEAKSMADIGLENERLIMEKLPEYTDPVKKKQALQETEKIFRSLEDMPQRSKKWQDFLYMPLLTKSKTDYRSVVPVTIDKNNRIRPYWKSLLQQSLTPLDEFELVSVADYGAVGDGKTDCTESFKAAIGKGNRRVFSCLWS